jgi:16S rRNA (cytosine967-C5)-methyltransferase
MLKTFRKNHIISILNEFSKREAPIDFFLHQYFKSHHAIGSHDRKEISEFVYQYIRWQALICDQCKGSIEEKVLWLCTHDPLSFVDDKKIQEWIRYSFPKVYFETLKNSLTDAKLRDFCLSSNQKAPVTIRANIAKISRDELLHQLSNRFDVAPTSISPYGIKIFGKATLFQTEEFKKGYFEMQDEASQLVSQLVEAHPKEAVLDFCCGAGGKTLGFAPFLEGQGQIYIHDVREHALLEAKKRFNRAGIQNFQILNESTPTWNSKKHKMDWVLVDAPCSGSGTLRRNPDQKWKFSKTMLDELVALQKEIFDKAIQFIKPKGKIVYATCSILKEENESQVAYFCEKYHLKPSKDFFSSIPKEGQMDGFFAAVLEKL